MNRRVFIASIPFLPTAVKAALAPAAPEDLWKCVITPNVGNYELRSVTWSMAFPNPKRQLLFHHMTEMEYRKHCLGLQLAMPAPNLP